MRSITPCPSALRSSSTQLVDILAQLLSSRLGRARAMARFVFLVGLALAVGDTSVAVPKVTNGTSAVTVLPHPTGVFPMPPATQSALQRPSLRGGVFGSNLTAQDGAPVSCTHDKVPSGDCRGTCASWGWPCYMVCGSNCFCVTCDCNSCR